MTLPTKSIIRADNGKHHCNGTSGDCSSSGQAQQSVGGTRVTVASFACDVMVDTGQKNNEKRKDKHGMSEECYKGYELNRRGKSVNIVERVRQVI